MQELVEHIADAVQAIDRSGIAFKQFQPGVGPYGEPQLVKLITRRLAANHGDYYRGVKICRTPDVLVPNRWALEFKIVRPFGDNGIEAEHWSQNLLHPYAGNVSAIGDAFKLMCHRGPERLGLIAICYEHDPPKIDLEVLVAAFELVSRKLLQLSLGERHTAVIARCIHPVHQHAVVHGWELAR